MLAMTSPLTPTVVQCSEPGARWVRRASTRAGGWGRERPAGGPARTRSGSTGGGDRPRVGSGFVMVGDEAAGHLEIEIGEEAAAWPGAEHQRLEPDPRSGPPLRQADDLRAGHRDLSVAEASEAPERSLPGVTWSGSMDQGRRAARSQLVDGPGPGVTEPVEGPADVVAPERRSGRDDGVDPGVGGRIDVDQTAPGAASGHLDAIGQGPVGPDESVGLGAAQDQGRCREGPDPQLVADVGSGLPLVERTGWAVAALHPPVQPTGDRRRVGRWGSGAHPPGLAPTVGGATPVWGGATHRRLGCGTAPHRHPGGPTRPPTSPHRGAGVAEIPLFERILTGLSMETSL